MRGERRLRRQARWISVTVAAGLALLPAAGRTQGNPPEALPPGQNASATVPLDFDICPDGGPDCPDAAVAEMVRRWVPLNNRCDHRAVFALTYLRTTEEFVRTVKGQPGFFSDGPWVNHEDAVFAELYFRAYDDFVQGRPVPAAWRVAFESTSSPNVTGPGDLLLGMNAHIQRDLPYTLAHVGLVKPDGSSRKPDHDRVNEFLDRVADPLQLELARRYDELFRTSDAEPSPADEKAVLQAVRGYRENAWRNAERLVNARDPAERAQVAQSIETYAEASARQILAANTAPGYGPVRDAYCRANNAMEPAPEAAEFRARLRSRSLGWVRSHRRLRLAVTLPAAERLTLSARMGGVMIARRVVRPAAGNHQLALPLTRRGSRALNRAGRRPVVRVLVRRAGGQSHRLVVRLRRP